VDDDTDEPYLRAKNSTLDLPSIKKTAYTTPTCLGMLYNNAPVGRLTIASLTIVRGVTVGA